MKITTIPYQLDTDIIYEGTEVTESRPHLPAFSEVSEGFVKPEDIPLNKRNFVYTPCAANPLFSELRYSTSEYAFEKPGFNYMDRSDGLALKEGRNDVVGVPMSYGWRSGRCDACIKEGTIYWEVEIEAGGMPNGSGKSESEQNVFKIAKEQLNATPHVRIGVSRREASLEAPVGFDSYSYGVRDNNLESIHEGKVSQLLNTCHIKAGDRLGFILHLPEVRTQTEQASEYTKFKMNALSQDFGSDVTNAQTAASAGEGPMRKRARKMNRDFQKTLLREQDHSNVIRDQIAIRYKNQLFFEATDYVKTTKPEYYTSDRRERHDFYTLEGSYLRVYLNGKELGNAFTDLRPFLPPFSELKYNEKFYFNYWRNGTDIAESEVDDTKSASFDARKKGILLRNKYVNNNRLGYYPTLSCFNGGVARIISDPTELRYWAQICQQEPVAKPLCDVYDEQIAEDVVWDVIDEVEAEILNGDLV